jgi:hypothetical protein
MHFTPWGEKTSLLAVSQCTWAYQFDGPWLFSVPQLTDFCLTPSVSTIKQSANPLEAELESSRWVTCRRVRKDLTIFKLTCRVCSAKPSTLQQERARAHQIVELKETETDRPPDPHPYHQALAHPGAVHSNPPGNAFHPFEKMGGGARTLVLLL